MSFYAALFGFYALFGAYMWVHSVLSDFVVPSIALEGVSLREAFRRMFALFRAEPGVTTGYVFLKPVLALTGAVGAAMAFYVALLVALIVAAIVALIVGLVLHLAHVPSSVLIGLGIVFGVLLYMATTFYGMGVAMGCVSVFLEAYTQFFLGGRYPALGELLERSTPVPVPIPAVWAAYPPYPPGSWPPPPAP